MSGLGSIYSGSFNIEGSFNTTNIGCNFADGDSKSKILAWLSPLDPRLRHEDIQKQRVDGVGQWVLDTKEFKSWSDGDEEDGTDRRILFCYGHPGVGKSYITSLAIDKIGDEAMEKDNAVAGFYFDWAARKQQVPIAMLGSLLKQLVIGMEEIPQAVVLEYQKQQKVLGGRRLQISGVVKMVQSITTTKRTFIFVDALDECVPEHRVVILDSLGQILHGSPHTRIFMTGRPQIRHEIERHHGGRVISLLIQPVEEEVITYLQERLKHDTNPEIIDSKLVADIMKCIPEMSSETFLLVSLHIERVLQESTIPRKRKTLQTITDGSALGDANGRVLQGTTIPRKRKTLHTMMDGSALGDAYETTLERIRAQGGKKGEIAMATLMWICHSERPLQVDELCHALAVEIGSTEFDPDNIPSVKTLLGYCQGLITVDNEASTVRLIHHTLHEYLSSRPDIFRGAHSIIAETCLTYLNSEQIKGLSSYPLPDERGMGFLKYSSRYWGAHAKRELSENGRFLALELLNGHEDHISAVSPLKELVDSSYFEDIGTNSLFSGLHCTSFFGLVELAAILIDKGCDINQQDCFGRVPLSWATTNGHEGIVKLLLEQDDVDPNGPDNLLTPLGHAAMQGHEGVMRLLLGREDVDPNRPDKESRTPLCCAAQNGHEGVVKLLLGHRDVDPNCPDNQDYTLLSWAAHEGHEGVVRLLLERKDVDPNRPDNNLLTPLAFAAHGGHERIVKLLLQREDIDPNRPDNQNGTPLSWAAVNGHEEVVKLLLGHRDVDPNCPDNQDSAPLSWAAYGGHEGVVKLLLERKDVDPNRLDIDGRTPLGNAAAGGHEGVVRLLLEREDVDPNRPDNNLLTPLAFAAHGGHERIVKLLLQREDIDPNRPDNQDGTPLSWAAANGHEEVVKLLLGHRDVDPNCPDNQNSTPLSWAACEGHEGVVRLLLEREDVDPNRPDKENRTPLLLAIGHRHEGVVELLLERKDVDPNRPDIDGRTSLGSAAAGGHQGLVKLLLERKDVDPNRPDTNLRTPLLLAALFGHEEVVRLLLGRDDVDPNCRDKEDNTPLSLASSYRHEEVVKLLLGRKDVHPIP